MRVGGYSIIVADPPWQYGFSRSKSRSIENHYPTMTAKRLHAMQLQQLINKETGTCLVMWVPFPKLDLGIDTIRAWGFRYVTGEPWEKHPGDERMGPGYYNRLQHELILYAQHPDYPLPVPEQHLRERSGIKGGWTNEHSAKPDKLNKKLMRIWPQYTARVELFARTRMDGWDCWGNHPDVKPFAINWELELLNQ
jgi:N6-adenosine-specific RNA methylase IME4